MREVKTPTSTTLEVAGPEELWIALELLDPAAIVLFDRDIACGNEIPEGLLRVQVNHGRPENSAAPYVAGWLYVCNQQFLYLLMVTPGSPEGGRWIKNPAVTIFDKRPEWVP